MNLKPHPVAALFPMIPKGSQSWNNLVESIKEVGQIEPIVIDDGVLIDGRNRLAVCDELKIKPRTVQWSALGIFVDQAEWILAKNIERRNLTDDQRVTIYVEYEEWRLREDAAKKQKAGKPADDRKPDLAQKSGQPSKASHNATRNTVAAHANVSTYKAEQALKLNKAVETGAVAPAVREQVKAGLVSLSDAVKQAEPVKEKEPEQPVKLETRVQQQWFRFLCQFPKNDHPRVIEIIKEIIE